MRKRELRFTVVDARGDVRLVTFDGPKARTTASNVGGTWKEEWVDAETGR